MTKPPVVLCLSGHDPTGGAGIQADIETLHRLGCHPATVVTALTTQDTRNVTAIHPQDAATFLQQARCVAADLTIAAVKIGLLGSSELAFACAELIAELPAVPVVLDPVLAAGGGSDLATKDLIESMRSVLLPRATVLTPNSPEARRLTGKTQLDECALSLLEAGCANVLITGTHEENDRARVVNRLYGTHECLNWHWQRLPHNYHGSGCTLASAIAGYLALGKPLPEAAFEAQEFTWNTLANAYALGRGQHLPNRATPV